MAKIRKNKKELISVFLNLVLVTDFTFLSIFEE